MATKRKKAARRASGKTALRSLERGEARLGNRPVWQGHLRLSLVSCPVALFNATSSTGDISFHLIRRKEKGEKLVTAEPVEESNVIDLMEALKKSLKNRGKPAAARATNSNAKRKAR
jgi:non-homologous end joining protein Ku